jgi:hypothetical protein
LPTEKLSFTLTGSLTDSTAEMDRITFNEADWAGYDPATQAYDYDLDIQQWSLALTSEYEITQNLALGVGVSMDIYEDDDPYLFDDSGKLYMMSASLNYVF